MTPEKQTQEEIIAEGNMLIAKFYTDGKTVRTAGGGRAYIINGKRLTKERLEFHSSWDALMPAIKKFDYLTENKVIEHSADYEFWCDKIEDAITRTYEIERVFPVFVEAIKWLNEEKETTQQVLNK